MHPCLLALITSTFLGGCLAKHRAASEEDKDFDLTVSTQKATIEDSPDFSLVYKPIMLSRKRARLIREYRKRHQGIDDEQVMITPRLVVVHCTANNSFQETFQSFYRPELSERPELRRQEDPLEQLNVSAHFIVNKRGVAYQVQPVWLMARHVIGLNHIAVGIENVGCKDGADDLTEAQAQTNIKLIKHLQRLHPTIEQVIGHYESGHLRAGPLWLEINKDYATVKVDPGPRFMQRLRSAL